MRGIYTLPGILFCAVPYHKCPTSHLSARCLLPWGTRPAALLPMTGEVLWQGEHLLELLLLYASTNVLYESPPPYIPTEAPQPCTSIEV